MIRHGQSTANAARKHAGWSQIPLTEQGESEARQAGMLLKDISFDRIYVSDLLRAKQTVQIALPGKAATETPLLREIHVGELAGKTIECCLAQYGESYLHNKAVRDFTPYGGETGEMHLDRIRQFVALLESGPDGCFAAFCHEGSIRHMLDIVLGEQHCREQYPLSNGSVCVFSYTAGKWSLAVWNSTQETKGG